MQSITVQYVPLTLSCERAEPQLSSPPTHGADVQSPPNPLLSFSLLMFYDLANKNF